MFYVINLRWNIPYLQHVFRIHRYLGSDLKTIVHLILVTYVWNRVRKGSYLVGSLVWCTILFPISLDQNIWGSSHAPALSKPRRLVRMKIIFLPKKEKNSPWTVWTPWAALEGRWRGVWGRMRAELGCHTRLRVASSIPKHCLQIWIQES